MWIQTTAATPLPWKESSTTSEYSSSNDDDNLSLLPISTLDHDLESHNANQDQPPNHPTPHSTAYHQFNLNGWIITPHQSERNPTPLQPSITPLNPEPPRQRNHFQPTLYSLTTNLHWGYKMINPKPYNSFWVLSKNMNTMSPSSAYIQWQVASQAIMDSQANAVAFQEMNTTWDKIHCQKVQSIFSRPTSHAIILTSSSTHISTTTHQRGGTLQAIIGNWTAWLVSSGTDHRGLGCWSYIELKRKMTCTSFSYQGTKFTKTKPLILDQTAPLTNSIRFSTNKALRIPIPKPSSLKSSAANSDMEGTKKSSVSMYQCKWKCPEALHNYFPKLTLLTSTTTNILTWTIPLPITKASLQSMSAPEAEDLSMPSKQPGTSLPVNQ